MSDVSYLSVCSGVEAASVANKSCSHCKQIKPLDDFHLSTKGKHKRASWCKPCANTIARAARKRTYDPQARRRWQIKTCYGLDTADFDRMISEQDGKCGICRTKLKAPHIDHDHISGKIRGILCHRCNIVIGGLDDPEFRAAAIAWIERGSK